MGITLIEQIGIVAGIIIGVSGFIYSVLQSRRQRKLEREQAAEQRKWEEKQAAEQAAKQEVKDRLYFLANIIMDKDIPRRSRQVFFDEYIAKGGNGSFVKFWYDEEKKLEAKKGE
jgi:type II secretory pathway pseudopilin PulG